MTGVVERYHVPKSQLYPGSRGAARGHVHLHVTEDVTLGRRQRREGESLCSKKHGSYERALEEGENEFRCPECETVAARHGIRWPSTPLEEREELAVAQMLTRARGHYATSLDGEVRPLNDYDAICLDLYRGDITSHQALTLVAAPEERRTP